MRTIAILGMGYVGSELGKKLIDKGFLVRGSTTTKSRLDEIKQMGVSPHLVHLQTEKLVSIPCIEDFLSVDCLVMSFPPPFTQDDELLKQQLSYFFLQARLQRSLPKYVIFLSSTSVYGEEMDEEEKNRKIGNDGVRLCNEEVDPRPEKINGRALFKAEKWLRNFFEENLVILRLGGIVGPERFPHYDVLSRENQQLSKSQKRRRQSLHACLNLVHLQDIVNVLIQLIEKRFWASLLNVVSSLHPTRLEFYKTIVEASEGAFSLESFVKQQDLQKENFVEKSVKSGKLVSNEKILSLGFHFMREDIILWAKEETKARIKRDKS